MHHLGLAYEKINNTFIDNAENLDIVLLLYNLLEYGICPGIKQII